MGGQTAVVPDTEEVVPATLAQADELGTAAVAAVQPEVALRKGPVAGLAPVVPLGQQGRPPGQVAGTVAGVVAELSHE